MKLAKKMYPLAKVAAFTLGAASVSALSIALASPKAEAAVLVSNINFSGTSTANQLYQLSGSDRNGATFKAPAYASTLTNIKLSLVSPSTAPETVFIDLYNSLDSNNLPTGSVFRTISQVVTLNAFNPQVVTFSPTSTISLNPNANYAFAVRTASGSSFQIQSSCVGTSCANSPGYTGITAPPLQIFNTTNGGSSWNSQLSQRVFEINVSNPDPVPVPEPITTTGVILASGMGIGLKKKLASIKSKRDA